MTNLGETANSSAEGEVATNSQAKGPNSDGTLESLMTPKKQSFTYAYKSLDKQCLLIIFGYALLKRIFQVT